MDINSKKYWIIEVLETPKKGDSPGLVQIHASHAETMSRAIEKYNAIIADQIPGHIKHAIITKTIGFD